LLRFCQKTLFTTAVFFFRIKKRTVLKKSVLKSENSSHCTVRDLVDYQHLNHLTMFSAFSNTSLKTVCLSDYVSSILTLVIKTINTWFFQDSDPNQDSSMCHETIFEQHCPIVRGDIKGCEICTQTYFYGCQCCKDVKYENIFLDCNSSRREMIGKILITPFL